MIYLTATTDKLEVVSATATAIALQVQTNYLDLDSTTGVFYAAGRANAAITTATTTDISGSPGSGKWRTIKGVTIRNKDATYSQTPTVRFNQNGTTYEIHSVTLQPNDCLQYIEGVGWFVLRSNVSNDTIKLCPSDVTFATNGTWSDITGLTVAMLSGRTYVVDAILFHISSATTNGAQFSFNIDNIPTFAQFGNVSGVTNSVTGGTISLGTATARDTAITAQTTGSANVTITHLAGSITPSADGTFALRAMPEVTAASGLIVKQGSSMRVRLAA